MTAVERIPDITATSPLAAPVCRTESIIRNRGPTTASAKIARNSGSCNS
jgi:hypothetical protein